MLSWRSIWSPPCSWGSLSPGSRKVLAGYFLAERAVAGDVFVAYVLDLNDFSEGHSGRHRGFCGSRAPLELCVVHLVCGYRLRADLVVRLCDQPLHETSEQGGRIPDDHLGASARFGSGRRGGFRPAVSNSVDI